jgi:FkbM family methyltransferase
VGEEDDYNQTMALRHIESFLHKSWDERVTSVRYYFRQSLAQIPYAPVPVRIRMSETEEVAFWWSYVVPFFDEGRGFFDYWGHDLGDVRYLWRVLRPGMVFLDIGAHHGLYSLVAAKRLGADSTVVAFEPSQNEFRRLRLHLRLNGMRSVLAEPIALGATSCKQKFFQVISGDNTRGGLRPPASPDRVLETSVETASLDEYLARLALDRVDLVKLDVEGGELEVLQGASSVLAKFRPIFICEVLDATTQVWGYNAREIVLMFKRHDFRLFEIQLDGSIVPHEIKDHYPDVRNYLAVPEEQCGLS